MSYYGTIILNLLVALLIIFFVSVYVRLGIKKRKKAVVPGEKFSLQNVMEVFVEWLLSVLRGIMGERADKFFPLIGSLFIFILICNLLGFFPGLKSPTTEITVNLGCALVVFVYYNYVGIRESGFKKYSRQFLGPVIWLAPLFLFVEVVTHLMRPVTLSVRLFGNMMGDHMVYEMFSDIIPIIVPIFFMIIGIFISFIQAFIFSILTAVYIALATEH